VDYRQCLPHPSPTFILELTMSDAEVEHVEIPEDVGERHRATAVAGCHPPDGFAFESRNVAIESLAQGATLIVQTVHSRYRMVVIDGPRHLLRVQGGTMFADATNVRLEGATAGGWCVKPGWIVVGLKIDMSIGERRIRSSPVRSVAIEGVSSLCPGTRVAT
jgi:hypothetical protein